MRTFFTSDSHFGHDNIIKHCQRPCREHPFRDGAQMDRALMDAWNSVVSPGDVVYHLGDFSMRPAETINSLLKKLHGIKHLIVGNHDRVDEVSGSRLQGWASVREMAKISVDGQSVFLCRWRISWVPWHVLRPKRRKRIAGFFGCGTGISIPRWQVTAKEMDMDEELLMSIYSSY